MAVRFPLSSFGGGSDTDPFTFLHDEMDRLFGRALYGLGRFPSSHAAGDPARVVPRMDVTETESEFRLEIDVPGVAREHLELALDGDTLTVRGRREPARRADDRPVTSHLSERALGGFERSIRLPFAAQMEQCQATLRDGVLTITLAKADAQRRARRIEIRGPHDEAQGASRTPLEHGQTEVLDAEPSPGDGASGDAGRGTRRTTDRRQRQRTQQSSSH
jgi:HSP20 family protein